MTLTTRAAAPMCSGCTTSSSSSSRARPYSYSAHSSPATGAHPRQLHGSYTAEQSGVATPHPHLSKPNSLTLTPGTPGTLTLIPLPLYATATTTVPLPLPHYYHYTTTALPVDYHHNNSTTMSMSTCPCPSHDFVHVGLLPHHRPCVRRTLLAPMAVWQYGSMAVWQLAPSSLCSWLATQGK